MRNVPSDPWCRRRRRPAAWAGCALLAVLLSLLVLVLALTVFKPREPRLKLVSATVGGVAPRVTLPTGRVELNVTLDLDLLVYNPNRASFSHDAGRAALYYRGNQVGDADIAGGRIPARGSAHVYCRLTIEAERFAAEPAALLSDVVARRLGIDASTRIPGRVTLLGLEFVTHRIVAVSNCHVVIGFPELRVEEQQCQQKTEL